MKFPMPQPINPKSWSFEAGATLARPEISAIITAIMAEWTWVENGITSLIGNAFGVSTDPKAGGAMFATNRLVYDMMGTAETIRTRLALMDATIGKLLAGTGLEARWVEFRKDVTARSKERNRLVHAQWMISDQYPDDLIEYRPRDQQMYRWTSKDVLHCLDRIIETRAEAHALLVATAEALHAGEIAEGEFGPRKVEAG